MPLSIAASVCCRSYVDPTAAFNSTVAPPTTV
jgi:hypothetical protein